MTWMSSPPGGGGPPSGAAGGDLGGTYPNPTVPNLNAYTAGTTGDWAGSAPTTISDAINRLAAAFAALHGPVT